MQRKLILFMLLFASYFVCSAQEGKTKEIPLTERAKDIVEILSKKVPMTKEQKDSISAAFLKFMDDLQKYNAQGNEQIMDYLAKTRDDKIKTILQDDQKFDLYLQTMADLKKQMQENQGQQRNPQYQQGNPHKNRGMGMPGSGRY